MSRSKLTIVGLNCFLNRPFTPQEFSALIYEGKVLKEAQIIDPYSSTSPTNYNEILFETVDRALQDCRSNNFNKVALITANNELESHNDSNRILIEKLSNTWDFSIRFFKLNGQTDCLLKALEIAQILLEAQEVDTVIIAAVNSEKNITNAGAIIVKDYDTAASADRIYAVIETAKRIPDNFSPSSEEIKQSCQQAWETAKINFTDIGYLEVSTLENSPEFLGLIDAYAPMDNNLTCAVGNVRANLGSLGITAGIISLIKTALCLYHRYLPAQPQWDKPENPESWQNSSFYVAKVSHPWFLERGQQKRQAAIDLVHRNNSYGHIILSEVANQTIPSNAYLPYASFYLFPLAAENYSSLQSELDQLATKIDRSSSLPHLARENFKQFQSKKSFPYVVAIVGDSKQTLQKEIKQAKKGIEKALDREKPWKSPKGSYFTPKPIGKQGKIAFVYPGAFNSYLGMGRNLWQLFPQLWERAASLVKHPGEFFQAKQLYPRSQTALSKRDLEILETKFVSNHLSHLETGTGFAVMFTHIMQNSFGIKPQFAFGYSMGEGTMMYALGVWANADRASKFVHTSPLFRSSLMGEKQTVLDYWGESSTENLWSSHVLIANPHAVRECLQQEPRVYLTHVNTPQEVVIAGDPQGCLRVIDRLGCDHFRSPSDMVLHCEAMQSEFSAFMQLNTVTMGNLPDTVFYSSANYLPIPLEQNTIAQNLSQGVCQPLEFPRLIDRAYKDGVRIFLELGSGGSCSRWITETLNGKDHLALCINRRGADDLAGIVKMLAQLVSHKVDVDLSPLYLSQEEEVRRGERLFAPTEGKGAELSRGRGGKGASKRRVIGSTLKIQIRQAPFPQAPGETPGDSPSARLAPKGSNDVSLTPSLFNEDDILEFIEGKVSNVFGEKYREIDNYSRRVRMPSPPFLFVSRVTQLEGELGNYRSGFIETEYDIPPDTWYAVDGQLTVGICKEAGHGLLMLLSYLGTDFESKGERSFRLLDLSATFLFEQPENIKTLKCRVKITSSVTTDNSLLVFFQGEALIGDRVWMKLHDGCAGIFSDEELEQGQGIVLTDSEAKKREQIQKQKFTPLLTCSKASFKREDILHLTQGNKEACFDNKYQQPGLNPSLRLPPEKLLMLDDVIAIDTEGGAAGLGLAIGSKQITPKDWYFACHFRNDPTLPGNLMIEGCIQLVQFYCLFLGLQTLTKDARFQIIPGKTQIARFRGQVTPQTGKLMYQMEVLEIGLSPQPYIIANVDVIFGGKTIAAIKNIGVQLAEKPVNLKNTLPQSQPKSVLFNEEQLKQFAKGSVSACLGSEFSIYDDRQCVRLPNGDFQLVNRVLDIKGKRHELQKPAEIITEFDVKPNAWFYEHNAYPTLPYCTYIEIAGQPCIFLGVYMGATLLSPDDDLHFRNLDGQGTILKEIDLRNKTITDRVRLISTTAIQGAIIQKFEFELACEGEIFYRGNMVFGDFSTAVLANQVGLDGGKRLKPWYKDREFSKLKLTQITLKNPNWREKLYHINPSKPHYRLSEKYLDFLDEVMIIEQGGNYQQGYIYGTKLISSNDWYFPFHFYQDPVMPGALGIESIIQAMQTYALHLDLGKTFKNPRFAQAINHQITWKYRGQITPENNLMSLEVHISKIQIESEKITLIGDASLWKEDLRIYEIKDLALCLVEG